MVEPTKPIPKLDISSVGIISTQVEDSPYKLFIGGLPHEMQEDQVKTMLMRFGQLKSFHLVKERMEKNSKGYAFCEYLNEESTQACVEGLNNVAMGHRVLNVKRSGTARPGYVTSKYDANIICSGTSATGGSIHSMSTQEESKNITTNSSSFANAYTDKISIDYFKSSKY